MFVSKLSTSSSSCSSCSIMFSLWAIDLRASLWKVSSTVSKQAVHYYFGGLGEFLIENINSKTHGIRIRSWGEKTLDRKSKFINNNGYEQQQKHCLDSNVIFLIEIISVLSYQKFLLRFELFVSSSSYILYTFLWKILLT